MGVPWPRPPRGPTANPSSRAQSPMDLTPIRKLVQLMQKADLAELEIDDQKSGLRVHLRKGDEGGGAAAAAQAPVVHVLGGAGAPAPVAPAAAPAAAPAEAAGPPPGTEAFESPMVGTFYRSPSPDADPFVSAGSKFTEDSVLCIVEAMKVMNEIKAEFRGEIVEVLVENGEPVEFGQPLFLIKKG